MNLSPFTKGSRVLRALNVIYSIFVRIHPLTFNKETMLYMQIHVITLCWSAVEHAYVHFPSSDVMGTLDFI